MFNWTTYPGGLPRGPPVNDFQQLRGRQIASLHRAVPNVRAINQDQSIFDVSFTSVGNVVLFLRITLGPRFPTDAPAIQVLGGDVRHPLLDNNGMVCGHHGLANWSAHSDLGRIARELLDEFQRNPPAVPQNPYAYGASPPQQLSNSPPVGAPVSYASPSVVSSPSAFSPVQSGESGRLSQTTSTSQRVSSTSARVQEEERLKAAAENLTSAIPPIPSEFPELQSLSKTEIERLLVDSEERRAFMMNLSSVKAYQGMKEEVFRSNVAAARKNLELENEIEQINNRIDILRVELQNEIDSFRQKQQRQQTLAQQFQPQQLVERLAAAAAAVETQTRQLDADFTDGKIGVTDFGKEYVKLRTLYYVRKLKVDKLRGTVR